MCQNRSVVEHAELAGRGQNTVVQGAEEQLASQLAPDLVCSDIGQGGNPA